MAPTYYLFSGKLFHAFVDATDGEPETVRDPEPRHEDPGPEGPEGEPVGEDDEKSSDPRPEVGPGAPLVPPHGAPDANPIDPRVFERHH